MKKLLLGLVAVVFVFGSLGYLLRRPLTMALIPRIATRSMQSSVLDDLPDGLHVGLCGAGSPLTDPQRSGPCVAVVAGERLYVVDAGAGSSQNLGRMGMSQGEIDAILLTHFHSDHIDGLGQMLMQRWVGGAHATPVPIHGPEGVEEVVGGFNQSYRQDAVYRTAHHGEEAVPHSGAGARAQPFPLPGVGEGRKIVDEGDLTITAFAVDHEPVRPAVGYRFDYKGRSVLVSGDTKKSSNLEQFAEGVDLLVHEALDPKLVGRLTEGAQNAGRSRTAKMTRDILDYHTSPLEVAEIARDSGTQALLFYHVVPPLRFSTMEEIFVEGVDDVFSGPVTVGRDGTFVSLPAGLGEIAKRELF